MRKVKLNEILEECLAAVLEGRRSVDDCLSLYPQFAPELEPLLATALEVSDTFQTETPSWHIQERTRLRVLAAHQARIRSRNLVSGVDLTRSTPWRTRHWGLLGAAAAAAVGAVIVGSTLVFTGGSGDGSQTANNPGSDDVFVVSLVDEVDEAKSTLENEGLVDIEALKRLIARAEELSSKYPDAQAIEAEDPETREQIQQAVADIGAILEEQPDDTDTSEDEDLVRELADKQKELAEDWGVVPTPAPPVATGTPGPTTPPASPTPTDDPTVTPQPTPTKAPSPTATPTPAPTPEPTATPDGGSGEDDPIRGF